MDNNPCTYRISIKAIITNESGEVLLLQEKDGSWELPGGGIEHGETVKQTLIREIKEETGMSVDWIHQKPKTFWTITKDVGSPSLKWFAFIAYEIKVSGDFSPSVPSDEAIKAQYFTVDKAKTLKLHDNTKPYFSSLTEI